MRERHGSRSARRGQSTEEGSLETLGHHDALQRSVGNRAVGRMLAANIQRRSAGRPPAYNAAPSMIHEAARRGAATPSTALPFAAEIQRSFGNHDVSGVRAHHGSAAAEASLAMGAAAYTTGDHVVFAGTPDLRTAAHEAAHAVQQRAGVDLPGGVGREGDEYERHADEVASRVVTGRSAEDLLGSAAGDHGGATQSGVQRMKLLPNQVFGVYQQASYSLLQLDGTRANVRDGTYNYVVMDNGIRVSSKDGHPHLAAGRKVKYAGMLDIMNGHLAGWNNHSGHYLPDEDLKHQAGLPEDLFSTWEEWQNNGWPHRRKTMMSDDKPTIDLSKFRSIPITNPADEREEKRCSIQ